MEIANKRDLLVSKAWIQAVAVVVLFGFFVLGLLAYRTYSGEAISKRLRPDHRGVQDQSLRSGDRHSCLHGGPDCSVHPAYGSLRFVLQ